MKNMLPRLLIIGLVCSVGRADPPTASYIFPPGGQRGKQVAIRVGGVNLHSRCGFELSGVGVTADAQLRRVPTVWFEGPILPLPESQQQEDYPKDMAGMVRIAADAAPGARMGRVWTSQGASTGLAFVVGDWPEVVEAEADGPDQNPTVSLPATINGRMFPREDVDAWPFRAMKGQVILAEAIAGKIGFPLEPRLEILDEQGRRLAENGAYSGAVDARVRFTAPADGTYRVRIFDARFLGGQNYIYRLSISAEGKASASEIDTPVASNPINVPAAIRGRISNPGEVDAWPMQWVKGSAYEIDLSARRIDSPLIPLVVVRDPAGKELARFDASSQNADPKLTVTAPADGIYRIEVADRFRARGGPEFAYSLSVRPAFKAVPDFQLTLAADALTVPRGGKGKLKIAVERTGGFKEPIEIAFDGLPKGVQPGKAIMAANQANVEVTLDGSADAPIATGHVKVTGTSKIDGKPTTRTARFPGKGLLPASDTVFVAVALPTPFVVKADYLLTQAPRGTVYPRKYRIERNGFSGPITVTLADKQARHLQGVSAPTLVVPPDKSEFEFPIAMPPWMEIGRTCRVCIMATAEVKLADGSTHEVSFSSVEQNMQIIIVVEPGRLGVEAERTSVRLNGPAKLGVRVQRGEGLKGPARVEIVPSDFAQAEAITIPADQSGGTIVLKPGKSTGDMSVIIRAIVMDGVRPVTAETRVDLVSNK